MDTTKSRIGYVLRVCGNLRTSADICGHLRLARARVSGYPGIRLSGTPYPLSEKHEARSQNDD